MSLAIEKNWFMELFCVNIIDEGKGPFEIIFSAISSLDAKNIINEKHPNCKIISVDELYKK